MISAAIIKLLKLHAHVIIVQTRAVATTRQLLGLGLGLGLGLSHLSQTKHRLVGPPKLHPEALDFPLEPFLVSQHGLEPSLERAVVELQALTPPPGTLVLIPDCDLTWRDPELACQLELALGLELSARVEAGFEEPDLVLAQPLLYDP
ncbi:P-loop containing nucleoside triphosphatehydrolases superfamily protein [Striga asiatica]|uniref:P-loop containing nucleoside triphosphatehydrolases superfamily protein n=1 Tax=Striga asiatica TaxID=4170 RepID=A0A5A7R8S3_STRAF|nr:P-loop containing nucleoside triphosphatehydrolases superfamily protein [Striga asiatica]